MDETEFPFHIVQSSEFENYCLHYEGGGLAIRKSLTTILKSGMFQRIKFIKNHYLHKVIINLQV